MLLKTNVVYSTIDSLSNNGFYSTTYSATGDQTTNMIHITWDGNFMSQIKCGIDSQISHRTKAAGVWQSWRTILDANNYSNYCAAASHTHSGYAASNHTHSNYAASSHTHTYSSLTGKPITPVFVGSIVKECTAGELPIGFDEVGITSRPSIVIVTVESEQGFGTYMFDSSTTYIRIILMKRLIVNTSDHENITPINGNVRIGLVVYQ